MKKITVAVAVALMGLAGCGKDPDVATTQEQVIVMAASAPVYSASLDRIVGMAPAGQRYWARSADGWWQVTFGDGTGAIAAAGASLVHDAAGIEVAIAEATVWGGTGVTETALGTARLGQRFVLAPDAYQGCRSAIYWSGSIGYVDPTDVLFVRFAGSSVLPSITASRALQTHASTAVFAAPGGAILGMLGPGDRYAAEPIDGFWRIRYGAVNGYVAANAVTETFAVDGVRILTACADVYGGTGVSDTKLGDVITGEYYVLAPVQPAGSRRAIYWKGGIAYMEGVALDNASIGIQP